MAIEKMRLVQVSGNVNNLDETLLECSGLGRFHPEIIPQSTEKSSAFVPYAEENPYRDRLAKIQEISATAGIELVYNRPKESHYTANDDIYDRIEAFRKELAELISQRNALAEAEEHGNTALVQLGHLDKLDVNLDDIFACQYVQVRIGRMPADSYEKLKYYNDRIFFFMPLDLDKNYRWGIYFTTEEHKAEIDDIFSSLYFERIWIPEFLHGTPGNAMENLAHGIQAAKHELEITENMLKELVTQNEDWFSQIYSYLKFRSESFELRRYVTIHKEQFHLIGYIPKRDQAVLEKKLSEIDGLTVEFKPQSSDKRLTTPTLLKNNFIFQPFEMFLEMYGTPAYNEIDPTPFLGATYILLFGIMFGDVGQGLAIALLGEILWVAKKMNFGRILVRIGFSATFFGFIYGSVFGMEHVLDPFYKNVLGMAGKPVEVMDPMTINSLLIFAVGLGIVMILISMSVNIALGFKHRDWERAVFSNNGIAGMIFYVAVLVGALSMLTGGKNLFTPVYIIAFIAAPILAIFLKHPLGKLAKGEKDIKPEDGIASFLIEGFFELFEVVLSFVTNTLSFLRVGGFIISHAGMMAVVITLTEMVGGSGSIAVMICGNIFVMALEGFIVGIQCLRLEFYEMFSRYFEGEGKPFRPISIGTK